MRLPPEDSSTRPLFTDTSALCIPSVRMKQGANIVMKTLANTPIQRSAAALNITRACTGIIVKLGRAKSGLLDMNDAE